MKKPAGADTVSVAVAVQGPHTVTGSGTPAISGALLQALLDQNDCSLLLVDAGLRLLSVQGALFAGTAAQAELRSVAAQLSDNMLLDDLQALFAGRQVAPREIITSDARWLRRALIPAAASQRQALVSYRDTSGENCQRLLLESEKLVAESVMQRQSLQATLTALLQFVERQSRPGIIASLLFASDDGRYLSPGAAPSLPAEYLEAVAHVAIGPRNGSCGTAAYRRARVIVADIASDPLWEGFGAIALDHGLRACWSDPIISSTGKVLGTVAIYCHQAGAPSKYDLLLIDTVSRAAALAIEHARHEDRVPPQAAAEQSRRQRAITRLGDLALSEDKLQHLMDTTVRVVADTLDVPLCKVLELNAEGNRLELRAGVGWAAGLVGTASVNAGLESQAGYTLASKMPVRVDDLRNERRFSGPSLLSEHGVVSGISVIIMGPQNLPFGVLGAHSQSPRIFTDQDIDFVQSAANILAAAIRRCCVEASLRDSEQQFRHLANAISQIVWSADGAGRPEYFNERWYSLSGASAEVNKDTAWRAVLHPEDAPLWYNTWQECVAAGKAFELEYRFYDAVAGDFRWHLGRAVPVWDAQGKVCHWYGSSTDIDDQKRTQLQLLAQTHTLEMVNWVNSILASQLDLEILAQTVVDVGIKLIGAGFGAFFYGDEDLDPGSFRLYAGSGLHRDVLAKPPVSRLADVFSADLHGNGTIRSADISVDLRYGSCNPFDALLPQDTPARSYCAATIVSRSGEILGGLLFGHFQVGVFDAGDEDLIKGLATQAALAVDNARMYRALWESEDQARRQLEQINAIYATAPVGLCFLDARLRFKSMNQHLAHMAGTTLHDVTGKSLRQVLGEAAQSIQPLCEETLLSRVPILDREVCWWPAEDNDARHWLCSCYPIRGAADDVLGVNTVVQDITARKATEQAIRDREAGVRFILTASRVGTWEWNIETGTVHWSENMESLHGRMAGSFDGSFEDVLADVHIEDRARVRSAAAKAMEGSGDYQAEYRIHTATGIRWVESKGQVVRDAGDRPKQMAGISMDITERKQAEEALRVSESMLRNKADELAIAHRQKDDFLAMLAHELRNPLAPISNAVQLLKMQSGTGQTEHVPWAVDVIERQVGQISRLVDDLLDVARITRGRIELQKEYVDATDIMRQAVESVLPLMTTKQHVFEVRYPAEPLTIHVDPVRIVQSLANLLNNAAKFTPEGGRIVFSATRDSELVLRVTDNGVGIAPEIVPQVFDLFVQEDRSLDRRQGGLGLGLSLVKRLIEMHEGHVAVISAGMGRGSEFVVRLPLATPPARITGDTHAAARPVAAGMRALRILVVDDNAESAEAMAILLRAIGHEVNTAYNGQAALEASRDEHPDVVFLDIGLPLMDGYEVGRQLRALYGQDIVLIALTGYARSADDERQRRVAFDHYILKPVAFDHLQSLLAQHRPQ